MAAELSSFLDGPDHPMIVVTAQHTDDHAGCLVGFATQVSDGHDTGTNPARPSCRFLLEPLEVHHGDTRDMLTFERVKG